MKLKLDENLGGKVAELFRAHGHDVRTVSEEQLCAGTDENLIQACRAEERCLVSLDLDFGNPLLFKPKEFAGIAVLRQPRKPSPDDLLETVGTLINALTREDPVRKLWIVPKGLQRDQASAAPAVVIVSRNRDAGYLRRGKPIPNLLFGVVEGGRRYQLIKYVPEVLHESIVGDVAKVIRVRQ